MIPILISTYMCGRHPSSFYFEGFLGGRSKLSLPFKFCSFDRLHTVVQNCATSKLPKFFIRQFLPESTRKYPFQPTHRGALSNNYVIVQTTPDRTPQYCSNIDKGASPATKSLYGIGRHVYTATTSRSKTPIALIFFYFCQHIIYALESVFINVVAPATKSAHGPSQSAAPATKSAQWTSTKRCACHKVCHGGSQSAILATKSAHGGSKSVTNSTYKGS